MLALRRIGCAAAVYLAVGVLSPVAPIAQSPAQPSTPASSASNRSSSAPDSEATSAQIRKAVDEAIQERLRDSKVVEVETSQAIATRLSDWAKLFAFFIGIPLTLFAAWLGAIGLKSYKDVTSARDDVMRTFNAAREISARVQDDAEKLKTRVQEVSALMAQVQTQVQAQFEDLSRRVTSIENVVKFKASKTLTLELKEHLSHTLSQYYDYLKSVGVTPKLRVPTVIVDSKNLNASYTKNQILVHPELIDYPDVVLREFTHHVMEEIRSDFAWSEDLVGLESGLADYLPASFTDEPDFGKDIWPIFERHHAGLKVPNRNLKNHRAFSEVVPGHQQSNGNIWGGAWWELREGLGRETLDTVLIAAWKSFPFAESAKHLNVFPLEMIKQDGALNAGKHERKIRSVFESRGLSL